MLPRFRPAQQILFRKNDMKKITPLLLAILTLFSAVHDLKGQGTAFTYQGRFNDGGIPANGLYDFRFAIFDAVTNGAPVGGTLTNAATAVSNGLFTVLLDFGSGIFTGPP